MTPLPSNAAQVARLPRRLAGPPLTVALVAPSGFVDEDALDAGRVCLERLGHRVVSLASGSRWKYFSAPDADRLDALRRAAANPEVDVVMAARGGYGLTRLLPELDFAALADTGKTFIGFSDFTAFHLAALARAGMVTFAGPMAAVDLSDDGSHAFALDHMWNLLRAERHAIAFAGGDPRHPRWQGAGTIWGGNLSLVAHLAGTPYLPRVEGGILFLEDVNEEPYRVERMMMQLLHAGVLERQSALLLGTWNGCEPGALSRADYRIDDAIEAVACRLRLPVIRGFPFGHVRDKVTVPVGGHAEVTCADGSCTVVLSQYNRA